MLAKLLAFSHTLGRHLPTHLLGLTADLSVYSEADAYMQMCSIVFDH
jgi:hypothetical protein